MVVRAVLHGRERDRAAPHRAGPGPAELREPLGIALKKGRKPGKGERNSEGSCPEVSEGGGARWAWNSRGEVGWKFQSCF